MANYYGSCRSNYFKVKRGMEDEFSELASSCGFSLSREDKGTYIWIEDGGIPSWYNTGLGEDEKEIEWKDFAKFLVPGEVIHLTESGSEKMRYLMGLALFIRADGKVKWVNIHDVPKSVTNYAKKHKRTVTDCMY